MMTFLFGLVLMAGVWLCAMGDPYRTTTNDKAEAARRKTKRVGGFIVLILALAGWLVFRGFERGLVEGFAMLSCVGLPLMLLLEAIQRSSAENVPGRD